MAKGKGKGSSFERDISKRLSLWLSGGEREDAFWRTQQSGGRYTIRKRQGKETHGQDGDITATHEDYTYFTDKMSIECKAYKDLNLWDWFTGNRTAIGKFWKQTVDQAKSANKLPLLIAKQNARPVLFITTDALSNQLKQFFDISPTVTFIDEYNTSMNENKRTNVYLLTTIFALDHEPIEQIIEDSH